MYIDNRSSSKIVLPGSLNCFDVLCAEKKKKEIYENHADSWQFLYAYALLSSMLTMHRYRFNFHRNTAIELLYSA